MLVTLPNHLRPRREKIFGPAPSHRLDPNAKARLWAAASAHNAASRQPRQHQGPLTWATLRVLRVLLWRFSRELAWLADTTFNRATRDMAGASRDQKTSSWRPVRARYCRAGLSPIDFLVGVYQNEDEPLNVRVEAARTVCQYPKLQSVDVNGRDGHPPVVQVIRFADLPDERQLPPAGPTIAMAAENVVIDAVAAPVAAALDDEDAADDC